MNLAQATRMVLEHLELTPDESSPVEKPLPWRKSLGLNRRDESVRPIFWRNRNRSYIERTQEWDEFPNGRWGDSRSPAFGELDTYNIGLKGTNDANRQLWGELSSIDDVSALFVRYMEGDLEALPWSEAPISSEADVLRSSLVALNRRGFLTINSQPPVNGARSNHPSYGWGPRNGYVYQKAYLEVLVSPRAAEELIKRMEADAEVTYYAVNSGGELKTNTPGDGPNAVTWGVFPGKEIVQPTIVETVSFLAWKDEFFRLGNDWAHCYDAESKSRKVIDALMQGWWLINIVHNDFQNPDGIFPLFDGLEIRNDDLNTSPAATTNGDAKTNGHVNGHEHADEEPKTNGNSSSNGIKSEASKIHSTVADPAAEAPAGAAPPY